MHLINILPQVCCLLSFTSTYVYSCLLDFPPHAGGKSFSWISSWGGWCWLGQFVAIIHIVLICFYLYMYCLCVQKTGIARVYCTPLHKNLIDDGIAFTYIFLFYRLYQFNVCETINRKHMPEITYLPVQSTQLQYTYSYTCAKRIRKRARYGLCC
jgi:hypothetical protein